MCVCVCARTCVTRLKQLFRLDWGGFAKQLYSLNIVPLPYHLFLSLQISLKEKIQFSARLKTHNSSLLKKLTKSNEDGIIKLAKDEEQNVKYIKYYMKNIDFKLINRINFCLYMMYINFMYNIF